LSIWDDLIKYLGQVVFLAFICSAVFWGLASGSLAINAKSKNPLLHLVLGAMLHFVWFLVVGILALIALAKPKQKSEATKSEVGAIDREGVEDWEPLSGRK
jgi:hypothetical protein